MNNINKMISPLIFLLILVALQNYAYASEGIEAAITDWEYRLGDIALAIDSSDYDFDQAKDWHSFTPGSQISRSQDYEYLWLRVKLPDKEIEDPTLYLPGILAIEYFYPYQLYLNGELIYQNGSLEGRLSLPKHNHSLVSLPEDWQNSYLYFRFYNKGHQFSIGEQIISTIAPYQNLINNLFRKGLFDLLLALIYLLLGLFFIVIYLFKRDKKIYLYLAFFIFSMFIYTIRYNEIISYIFNQWNYVIYISYYFSLFILISSASLFIGEVIKDKRNLFKIIAYFYFYALLGAMISYFFNPISMLLVLKVYNLSIILFIIFSIYHLVRAFLKEVEDVKSETEIILLGVFVYGATVFLFVLSMLASQFELGFISNMLKKLPLNSLSLGMFFLILFLLYLKARRFVQVYDDLIDYSQKLKETNDNLVKIDRFKDEFVASASQDLKLPVDSIISSAESIIYSGFSFLPDNLKKELSSIINTGKGLDYMINSFIDYSNLKQGNLDLNKEKLELYEIIESIVKFFKPFVASKEIEFNNNIEMKSFIVIADKSKLTQIIYNLLDDLAKFTEQGEISFNAAKREDKIEIRIEIITDSIFFRYKDNSTDSNEEGEVILDQMDIKQYVTSQLIKLQEGELKIEKSSNKSLSLKVILPGEEYSDFYNLTKQTEVVEKELKSKQKETEFSPAKKKTILIVGNKASDVNSLQEILLFEDYSLQMVTNSQKAIDKLDNNLVLVILNLFALNKSSIELCRKIRNRFTVIELPILMMLARNSPEDLLAGFEVGINDLIKKPFEINQLKARVRTLINLKENAQSSLKHEQDFLRAQIKPHFLYNTLDTIAYLCLKDSKKASDLILDLAQYLRYSFDFESLNEIVSINKELKLVRFYISIEKARFKDRIAVKCNIDKDLFFGVPPLILQPIVENAIKHGILKKVEGGAVEISIEKEEDFFVIKVADDGIGMTEEELADLLTDESDGERHRVGLKNINKRLKRLYDQELIINSKQGVGTTVEFKIPDEKFMTEGS